MKAKFRLNLLGENSQQPIDKLGQLKNCHLQLRLQQAINGGIYNQYQKFPNYNQFINKGGGVPVLTNS